MFETTTTPAGIKIEMAATLDNVDLADRTVTEHLQENAVAIDEFAIRILVRESVNNAVIHGSGKQASLNVTVEVELQSDNLMVRVTDLGPGFQWEQRTDRPSMLGDGGRGIPLMRIYSDSLEFNETGNELTILKCLTPATLPSEESSLTNPPDSVHG